MKKQKSDKVQDQGKSARAERVAAALRDNLRKRKAQTKARAGEGDASSPETDPQK